MVGEEGSRRQGIVREWERKVREWERKRECERKRESAEERRILLLPVLFSGCRLTKRKHVCSCQRSPLDLEFSCLTVERCARWVGQRRHDI